MKKKRIVFSAVSMVDAGIYTILESVIKKFLTITDYYEVTFIVNDERRLSHLDTNRINLISIPMAKKRWIYRLYCEYYLFGEISKKIKPDIWVSLHDFNPRVSTKKLYVYCHNPSPFLEMPIKDMMLDPVQYFWKYFYQLVYRVNVKNTYALIVQQNWMATEMYKRYKPNKVVVARPTGEINQAFESDSSYYKLCDKHNIPPNKILVFYPSYYRYFKNQQALLDASKLALSEKSLKNHHFILTIDIDDLKYNERKKDEIRNQENISLIGKISREMVETFYKKVDILVFPSKLESWGLPLSEFSRYNKPIICSDLPYAKEVLSSYKKVKYFHPDRPSEIISLLKSPFNSSKLSSFKIKKNNFPLYDGWGNFHKIFE